jgi:hypothetical protein
MLPDEKGILLRTPYSLCWTGLMPFEAFWGGVPTEDAPNARAAMIAAMINS